MRRLFRTRDAARYLSMAASTLEKWRLVGKGPKWALMPGGRAVVYDKRDLDRWIDALERRSFTGGR